MSSLNTHGTTVTNIQRHPLSFAQPDFPSLVLPRLLITVAHRTLKHFMSMSLGSGQNWRGDQEKALWSWQRARKSQVSGFPYS